MKNEEYTAPVPLSDPARGLEHWTLAAGPGAKPAYSQHGYMIAPDGMVYALCEPYYHGVVTALLHPELLARFEFEEPKKEYNEQTDQFENRVRPVLYESTNDIAVFEFQEFEFWADDQPEFKLIRISTGRMITQFCLTRPETACTPEQIEGVRRVVKTLGFDASQSVMTDNRTMRLHEMWQFLERPDLDVFDQTVKLEAGEDDDAGSNW